MTIEVKTGMRLRSTVCQTEVIVVRAAAPEVDLRCGGRPMAPSGSAPAEKLPPAADYNQPTVLGKRYSDEAETIELLCAVGGPSALSVGEVPLTIKGPRALPASD